MGWEAVIIPIIGVAVWIISTLVRSNEEAKKPGAPGQRKAEKVTDLDRFLRDVQRRRQTAERQEQPAPQAERAEEHPAPPPRPREERRAPAGSRRKERPPVLEAIPVVLPVEVLTAELASGAPVMRVHEAPPLPDTAGDTSGRTVMHVHQAPRLPDMPVDTSARSLPQRPDSVAVTGVRELLQSRAGLRQAMILQVVLGPPLARRHRTV